MCVGQADVWSYGVCMWELLTGCVPFDGMESNQANRACACAYARTLMRTRVRACTCEHFPLARTRNSHRQLSTPRRSLRWQVAFGIRRGKLQLPIPQTCDPLVGSAHDRKRAPHTNATGGSSRPFPWSAWPIGQAGLLDGRTQHHRLQEAL